MYNFTREDILDFLHNELASTNWGHQDLAVQALHALADMRSIPYLMEYIKDWREHGYEREPRKIWGPQKEKDALMAIVEILKASDCSVA